MGTSHAPGATQKTLAENECEVPPGLENIFQQSFGQLGFRLGGWVERREVAGTWVFKKYVGRFGPGKKCSTPGGLCEPMVGTCRSGSVR